MPVLREPADETTVARLRSLSLDHTQRWRKRLVVEPEVWGGVPGGPHRGLPLGAGAWDHALRVDVVCGFMHRDESDVTVWLTRGGELTPHDLDQQWSAAVLAAGEQTGTDPTFVVITRRGWVDPRSGIRRTWVRLRG